MTEYKLPYIIKPNVLNRGFMIATLIGLIFILFIFLRRDFFGAFLMLITLTLIFSCVAMYMYKTIIVESDIVKYKGIFFVKKINFMYIKNIGLYSKEAQGVNRYYLIIEHEIPLVITDLQLYKKDDIRFLLNKINSNSPFISLDSIEEILNNIKWLNKQ